MLLLLIIVIGRIEVVMTLVKLCFDVLDVDWLDCVYYDVFKFDWLLVLGGYLWNNIWISSYVTLEK